MIQRFLMSRPCQEADPFQAIRYDGSSSHAGAIMKWLKGEPYVHPEVSTQDVNMMVVNKPDGSKTTVMPGDCVILFPDGYFMAVPESFLNSNHVTKLGA